MGNMLGFSDPITRTHNTKSDSPRIKFGSSSVQGWRIDMEDAAVNLLTVNGDDQVSFFAVFDGHGGAEVADYAKEHCHRRVFHHPKYKEGQFADAIQQAVMQLDQEMFVQENAMLSNDSTGKNDLAGSTAVMILMNHNRIFCGNVGDSRAVACVSGHSVELSRSVPQNSDFAWTDLEKKYSSATLGDQKFSQIPLKR